MKLACLGDTSAVPMRRPRRPKRVDHLTGGQLARELG